jgi:REP element-mobilizing transposase RayT
MEHGSMDRGKFNTYGGPKIPTKPKLKESDRSQLKSAPFELSAAIRKIVKNAIKEVCDTRGIRLYAFNIRTEHVDTVVGAGRDPERIMNDFKTYVTRKLRAIGLVGADQKVWSRHGSTPWLWTDRHIKQAIEYVLYGQGDDLPEFD